MKVRYCLTSEVEEYIEFYKKDYLQIIELIFSSISKEEEKTLKKLNVQYKYLNGKIKVIIFNFINYLVEMDGENKGIFIEKTKEYHDFYREASIVYKENDKTFNLIISKEGIRAEILVMID